jgi:hypothetical protein
MSSDRATIREGEPIPGMPQVHPHLGNAVLAYRPGALGRMRRIIGLSGLLFPVAGAIPWAMGDGIWLEVGLFAMAIWLILWRPWRSSRGGAFVLYENGVADPGKLLRWTEVSEFHLDADVMTSGGTPIGDYHFEVRLVGPVGEFRVAGVGAENKAIFSWIERHALVEPARRDLAKARAGGTVTYLFASLRHDGLRWGDRTLAWNDYARHEIVKGTLRVHSREKEVLRVRLQQANAMLLCAVLREIDRERVSDGEAAKAR